MNHFLQTALFIITVFLFYEDLTYFCSPDSKLNFKKSVSHANYFTDSLNASIDIRSLIAKK